MFPSDADRINDPFSWIDGMAPRLLDASRHCRLCLGPCRGRGGVCGHAQIMTAAIRLYVAKSDGEERTFRPIIGEKDSELSATELLSAVSELLRALRLGPMELALWYRRRPDEP